MAKRPTPKKRQSNSSSGNRYGAYLRKQWHKLRGGMNSPFASFAEGRKPQAEKALEKITKIKA